MNWMRRVVMNPQEAAEVNNINESIIDPIQIASIEQSEGIHLLMMMIHPPMLVRSGAHGKNGRNEVDHHHLLRIHPHLLRIHPLRKRRGRGNIRGIKRSREDLILLTYPLSLHHIQAIVLVRRRKRVQHHLFGRR